MIGPGKYDAALTQVREETKARGAALIVFAEGENGAGFSVQMSPLDLLKMPEVLRYMAKEIEADLKPPGLGATGEFPEGKADSDDEGELRLAITHDRDNVRIDFGKPVAWLGFSPDGAIQFARLVVKNAVECR